VPAPTKPKKVGRPKLPKGEAKGKVVVVRLTGEGLKAITAKATASDQTVSQWIRSTLNAAIQG
jgi:predicted HicB family RNase H-like nuclease